LRFQKQGCWKKEIEYKPKISKTGDIHTEMKLKNNMPAVCGALQTQIFEQDANVKRIRITGPGNGANCIITFDIL